MGEVIRISGRQQAGRTARPSLSEAVDALNRTLCDPESSETEILEARRAVGEAKGFDFSAADRELAATGDHARYRSLVLQCLQQHLH